MLAEEQVSTLRWRFPILRQKRYLYNCSEGALRDAAEAGLRAYTESGRSPNAPDPKPNAAAGPVRSRSPQWKKARSFPANSVPLVHYLCDTAKNRRSAVLKLCCALRSIVGRPSNKTRKASALIRFVSVTTGALRDFTHFLSEAV